jgi:hypothetical protein
MFKNGIFRRMVLLSEWRYSFLFMVVASGLLGFLLAMRTATWQAAVEPAQILAGLVNYPRSNPFYIHQTKIWTILHQIGAICLWAGMSERTLSLVLSGLLGMVIFQAMSMTAFVFSRSILISLLIPFFLFYIRATNFGVTYPVLLMGYTHTYGILALSYAVLALALLGAGKYEVGGFLLGLSPAIHPPTGALLWLVVLACLGWDRRGSRSLRKRAIIPFLVGAGVAVFSLILHFLLSYDVPVADRDMAMKYVNVFVKYWDLHRSAVPLMSNGIFLNIWFVVMGVTWLYFYKKDLGSDSTLFVRGIILFSIVGLGSSLLTHLPPQALPTVFHELMPSRFLNVVPFCFMGILISAMFNHRDDFLIQALLSFFIPYSLYLSPTGVFWMMLNFAAISLMLGIGGIMKRESGTEGRFGLIISGIFLFILPFVTRHFGILGPYGRKIGIAAGFGYISYSYLGFMESRGLPGMERYGRNLRMQFPLGRKLIIQAMRIGIIGILITVAVLGLTRKNGLDGTFITNYGLDDRREETVLNAASKDKGMLLLCSELHLIQLRTRRPVLLDGGYLDMLPYSPEVGPEMGRILRIVYGVNLFEPPDDVKKRPRGMLPRDAGRSLWEGRTEEDWKHIREEFGVSQVLTYSDWRLKLPVSARSEGLRLYTIP